MNLADLIQIKADVIAAQAMITDDYGTTEAMRANALGEDVEDRETALRGWKISQTLDEALRIIGELQSENEVYHRELAKSSRNVLELEKAQQKLKHEILHDSFYAANPVPLTDPCYKSQRKTQTRWPIALEPIINR